MAQSQPERWRVTLGVTSRLLTGRRNRPLYRVLLEDARGYGISGATAVPSIGGSHLGGMVRGVKSEIGSNDLPVTITIIDFAQPLLAWMPRAQRMLQGRGVVAVETESGSRDQAPRSFSEGLRVEVFTMESAVHEGVPLYQVIAEQLREQGAPWVSVSRALCGFGAARSVHRTRWLWKRADAPVVITGFLQERRAEAVAHIQNLLGSSGYVLVNPVYWSLP